MYTIDDTEVSVKYFDIEESTSTMFFQIKQSIWYTTKNDLFLFLPWQFDILYLS